MRQGLPRGVWALGLVSLFMDVSSEMIHALLPVYLVSGLGATMLAVGLIEGIAEATAQVVKVFSGALSDRIGRRKPLALAGYGLAALTKPVFPLAGSLGWIVAARFVDRVGKGIRGAPRDALVADLTPEARRGAAFGLRQTLDTVGAVLGPLIAIALMWLTADNIPLVFWAAVLPAVIAVAVLVVWVREPPRTGSPPERAPLSRAAMARLGPAFWAVTGVAALFALARFSEAFLVLKADHAGLTTALIPLVLIVMNVVYALAAYPAGALSDAVGRVPVLAVGVVLLVAGDLAMALAPGLAGAFAGIALWGASMGFTQGAFAAMVADTVPAALRGTGFGVLNLATGLATLAASLVAGVLWDALGPSATFLAGAGLGLAALIVLPVAARRR
ncbi:MFS transporter [Sinisalibacter aestuarii]|uniref:MFS transporter n=1 Tax=Sinisalibacter aestuarii TaxID=2949426 RepID=A0ABQ5LRH3_9RHOB|nr:MFS transporter [Sinisalibacter aestuarii]GKY87601.1 MFS transporter [Sinisalibacter aestuarii]